MLGIVPSRPLQSLPWGPVAGFLLQAWPGLPERTSVGRVLQLVARRRAPRTRAPDRPLGDGVSWPLLREQQALQARLGEAEQAAAANRAQVLVEQGWGALEGWLLHEGQHPGERLPEASHGETAVRRNDQVLSLFDAA